MHKKIIRYMTAVIFSIISSVLFSVGISSKENAASLSEGIWQATNTNDSLLHISHKNITLYRINNNHCKKINDISNLDFTKQTISDVHLHKEHNRGWLLSPAPTKWDFSFKPRYKHLQQGKTRYRKIKSLPDSCHFDMQKNRFDRLLRLVLSHHVQRI